MGRHFEHDSLLQQHTQPSDDGPILKGTRPADQHHPIVPIEDATIMHTVASDDMGTRYRQDDAKLARLEKKVNIKLALLDRLKTTDLHTAAWNGEAELVCAHIEMAAQHATASARRDLRHAQKALHALEIEAATMSEKKIVSSRSPRGHDSGCTEDLDEDGEADEYELAVACVMLGS